MIYDLINGKDVTNTESSTGTDYQGEKDGQGDTSVIIAAVYPRFSDYRLFTG